MTIRIQFLKEYWWLALIMNSPYLLIISMAFSNLVEDKLIFWTLVFSVYLFLSFDSIKDWYVQEQIDYLIKKTKNVKD